MDLQLPASFVEKTLLRPSKLPSGLRRPPTLSGGLPIAGHTKEFLTDPLRMLERAQKQGEIHAIHIAHKYIVAMFGPEAHEAVFRAPDDLLSAQDAYAFMTPIFGKGLVYDAPIEKMGEQVKMLLPGLKDRRMRTYGEAIVGEVERSLATWGDEGTLDVVDYCRVLTNFTSSRCLLGNEFRDRMNEEFAEIYHHLERGITPLAYLNPYLPLPTFKRRDEARVKLVGLIKKIIDERRRENREGEDFLQTLMDARYTNGTALDEDEITGMLLAALFAGHHTSSVTTAWTLVELLRDRRYLARTVAQLDEVYGTGEQMAPVDMASLRAITLTENAVKESLRIHPPLFMLIRVAQRDWQFKDYFIPKGSWVVVSPTAAHQNDAIFARSDRFEPDRFAPPREEDKVDWAYIPFGGGRHKCLGNAFAILQIKTILAMLLSRYEFDLHGDSIENDFQSMVIGPKQPCRIRYRKRVRTTQVAVPGAAATVIPAAAREKIAAMGFSPDASPHDPEVAKAAAAAGCPFHFGGETETVSASAPVAATVSATPATVPATIQSAAAAPPATAPIATAASAVPVAAAASSVTTDSVKPAPTVVAKKLRVSLDHDLCQGHAACAGEVPELFTVGDNGKVALVNGQPPPELYPRALLAAKLCPNRAIRITKEA